MPNVPRNLTISNVSPDVINAIRNSASIDYKTYVPVATAGAESIREIGAVLMDSPDLRAELAGGLFSRIAKVIVTSRLYRSKLHMMRKGILSLGEIVEDVYLELAKPYQYDPENAYATELKMEKPDMRVVYYVMNFEKFYKGTILPEQWEKAFLSWDSLTNMFMRIIENLVTSSNYDEQQVTLYMIGKWLLDGKMKTVYVPDFSKATSSDIVTSILGVSNDFTDMGTKYNLAGVHNYSDKDFQYLILNGFFAAVMNVNTLATSFHKTDAEFMGNQVVIGSFANLDMPRLAELFSHDPAYVPFTADEINLLSRVPAVLCDWNFVQIYDKYIRTGTKRVEEGEYTNYWLHKHSTYALSPFANAVAFVPSTGNVTSVAVTPSSATVKAASSLQLQAAVTADPFVPQSVTWSTDNGTVTASGIFTPNMVGTAKVTATSTADPTKKATATITVVA